MKFFLQVIFTFLLSFLLQLFLPWWIVLFSSFIVSFVFKLEKINAFLGGFSSVAGLWMIKAALIDVNTNHIISTKIGPILGLSSPLLLILITGVIGGSVGGMGALTASYFRNRLKKKDDLGYKW